MASVLSSSLDILVVYKVSEASQVIIVQKLESLDLKKQSYKSDFHMTSSYVLT